MAASTTTVAAFAASPQEEPLDVVAIGEDLSDEAKALAEEGLFDLVRDAWGTDASERSHAYLEEEALPYLPIDSRAFALAVEGRLE
ncbi:unnamed protein product, partial [Scytosiphon promiscuus]